MNFSQYKKINLPENPGVYLFKKNKDPSQIKSRLDGASILYIGKATSLRDRVKSYFSNDLIATRGPLLVDMVFQADRIDFIETDSVLEALILESNLIKKYQPKYNTKEKDDRSYNYVVITKENFPKILVERGKTIDFVNKKLLTFNIKLSTIFGPFTNGSQLKEALKIIRKIFPFLDKNTKENTSYKFYKEIGLAPDISSLEAKKDYAKNIKNIILFFEGKKVNIIKNLEKEMKLFAKKHEFEKADKIKKTIFALNHIQDIALIKKDDYKGETFVNSKPFRIEAYDVAHISGTNTVGVMVAIENGLAKNSEYRKFKIKGSTQNDTLALSEILNRRFNHTEWNMPKIIVVDGSVAQKNIAEKVLKDFGMQIPVVAVTKDERHRPKMLQGREDLIHKYESEILLANSEAHRFAIKYHREKREKIV